MKQSKSLRSNELGVIHHLGLIILAIVVVSAAGFAGFRVWQNSNDNGNKTETAEVDPGESDGTADNPENQPQDEVSSADQDAENASTAETEGNL